MKHPGGAGGGAGHSAKHVRSKKHVHGKGKHHPKHHHKGHHAHQGTKVHTVAKGHPHHPRGLALGDALPVCTFEALAMAARLAGYDLSDDDVAGLWDLAGRPEEGAGIGEALGIAARHGIGGVRPGRLDYRPLRLLPGAHDGLLGFRLGDLPGEPRGEGGVGMHALILGVDLPGPHTVLAAPDGWWSWGSLWSPWTSAVSEAWVVSWLS